MRRILFTLLFLSLVLVACSPSGLPSEAPPLSPTAAPTIAATERPTDVVFPVITQPVLPPAKLIVTVSTPHIEQGPDGPATVPPSYPEGCGYEWAYQDLPELSSQFLAALQTLQPAAQAKVFVFGEHCFGSDGRLIRFIPMETDFNITLQINDLTNKAELGDWIIKVMQIVDAIPADQIVGPRPGRVSLSFESNTQQVAVIFYVDQYHGLPPGLSGTEIYEALKAE